MQKGAVLGLALFLFAACKKNNSGPQMPAASHDGRQVVAWKLDGQVYVAEGYSAFTGHYGSGSVGYGSAPFNANYLYLRGTYIGDNGPQINRVLVSLKCRLDSELNKPMDFGQYPFTGLVSDMRGAGSTIPGGGSEFVTDSLHRGSVTVTYEDSVIIAGTFKMDVVNADGKVLHITDGMFDIGRK